MMKPMWLIGNKFRRSDKKVWNGRSGFTLLEVLVALAVLGYGITQVFYIFFGSIDAITHINNRVCAYGLLEDEVWMVRNLLNRSGERKLHYVKKDVVGFAPAFHLDVKLLQPKGVSQLYRLVVYVDWKEGGRKVALQREVNLTSI